MMSFVSMRLGKDAEATREMMACKNPADVAALQSRWVEETLRDYNAGMTKLMTICTKSVSGGGRAGG
jgi:Phasin protein